ncbi:hypothetical protein AYI68_g3453, partial [Smittium mucronatum]
MGKATAKSSRSRLARLNSGSSLGVPVNSRLVSATADLADGASNTRIDELPAVLKKVYSADVNDRFWAVASIGQLLCSENRDSFSDDSDHVVQEATGAIRNLLLSIEQQEYKPDSSLLNDKSTDLLNSTPILTQAITSSLNKYGNAFKSIVEHISSQNNINTNVISNSDHKTAQNLASKNSLEDSKYVFGILENLFVIIQTILETHPKGSQTVNEFDCVALLVFVLNSYSHIPYDLAASAGLLLYNMSESNLKMADSVFSNNGHNIPDILFGIISNSTSINSSDSKPLLFLRILAGATLTNLIKISQIGGNSSISLNDSDVQKLNRTLLELISQYIDSDYSQLLVQILTQVSSADISENLDAAGNDESKNKEQILFSEINSSLVNVTNVQLVLELAANIFSDEGFQVIAADADQPDSEDEWMDQDGDTDTDTEADQNNETVGDEDESMEIDNSNPHTSSGVVEKDNDFDEMDMHQILGAEGTLAQSVWDEAEPVISIFINSIIPKLVQLVINATFVSAVRDLVSGTSDVTGNSNNTALDIDCVPEQFLYGCGGAVPEPGDIATGGTQRVQAGTGPKSADLCELFMDDRTDQPGIFEFDGGNNGRSVCSILSGGDSGEFEDGGSGTCWQIGAASAGPRVLEHDGGPVSDQP